MLNFVYMLYIFFLENIVTLNSFDRNGSQFVRSDRTREACRYYFIYYKKKRVKKKEYNHKRRKNLTVQLKTVN